jgi:acetyl esterase/lipase
MPIGYLVTTGGLAALALAAVLRVRPRRSAPFRLSYVFGLWLNWPLVVFLLLLGSSALAIEESGDSPGLRIGLGLAAVAAAALVLLRRLARGTGPVLQRALDEGLGTGWRERVEPELAARLRRRPSLLRVLLAPVSARRIERIADVRYGPGRANLLDVYRDRSGRSGRAVLVHFHPLMGSKRVGTRHLFHRLAGAGWICLAANYRNGDDVPKVLAWVREHAEGLGADPATIFVAGSSLGGHLAARAAFAPGEPVAGLVCLYGFYGSPSARLSVTTSAPPCFVAHGDRDSLVLVEDARSFVEQLRATSRNPVVYAELPGAQHGFDLFRSRRFDSVVDAIEAFAADVRARVEST